MTTPTIGHDNWGAWGMGIGAIPSTLPGDEAVAAPKIETIVTDARIDRERASVRGREVSEELEGWVQRYAGVGNRSSYLWTWCCCGVDLTTLPCVPEAMRPELCDTKVLGIMLDVLLDDVADQGDDSALLEQLLGIPEGRLPASVSAPWQEYARFTADVWTEIRSRVRQYPRYGEFADVLRFDYLQLFNVMRYAHLLNGDLSLLNLVEHDLYSPHNMHMMISATIDLMCSEDFDHAELGLLREAIWHAQYMGRIGNLVTTWQRELVEGDYTAGVFADAVSWGSVTADDLTTLEQEDLERRIQAGGHESRFLERWRSHHRQIGRIGSRLRSIDLRPLLRGLERLICLHVGSRGSK